MVKFEFTTGDILQSNAEALVNPVNCVGVMGAGLALQFKEEFPSNFRAYQGACALGDLRPGRVLAFATNTLTGRKLIINFPTKRHWNDKSRIEDIDSGLLALADKIVSRAINSIAIPALGCGLGGLAWSDVRPRIVAALQDLPDLRVVVYEPQDERPDPLA